MQGCPSGTEHFLRDMGRRWHCPLCLRALLPCGAVLFLQELSGPALCNAAAGGAGDAPALPLWWLWAACGIGALLLHGWGLCLWQRERQGRYRDGIVVDACSVAHVLAQKEPQRIWKSLVQFGLAVAGSRKGYLVLFVPEPVVVCHVEVGALGVDGIFPGYGSLRGSALFKVVRQSLVQDIMGTADGMQQHAFADVSTRTGAPLAAREFWSPLLDGEPFVLQERRSKDFIECGYPVECTDVGTHVAVAVLHRNIPVAVLGVAKPKGRYASGDTRRLKVLLTTLWEYTLLQERLVDCSAHETLYEGILNATPYGMALLSERGEILETNTAFKALYGMREDVPVRYIFGMMQSEERYVMEDTLTRVLHVGGAPVTLDIEQLRGGMVFTANMSLVRLPVRTGFRVLMVVNDVSAQREEQQQLEAYKLQLENMVMARTLELKNALLFAESTRDRIDMILRSIADGLLVTDMHNRIILMNQNAEQFLGIELNEAVGLQVGQALENTPFRLVVEERVAQTRAGVDRSFEFTVPGNAHRPDRHLRAVSAQVRDAQKVPVGVVTIMHDASKERELEKMKSEFLSMAAHELRTPLTTIQGFSDILLHRHDISEADRERFLGHVNVSAQTLSGIVSDLLDISRIESGTGFSLALEKHSVGKVTAAVVEAWAARSVAHTIRFDAGDEEAYALIDEHKFRQILENIIGNSVKYSPEGGEIVVSMETDDALILFTVLDHGMGMTPEQLAKVFDKFYRVHSEKVDIPGTGLGLPIVRSLVEAHGGEIWLESALGRGTSVYFTLPTAQVATAKP